MPKRRADIKGTHRYGYVLLSVIATFIVLAAGDDSTWVRVLAVILQATTLVLVFYTGGIHPRYRRLFILFFVLAWFAAVLVSLFVSENLALGLASIFGAVIVLAAATGIARGVGVQPSINIGTVNGALAIYLILGLFFSDIYSAVDRLDSGPFFAGGQSETTSHFLYFSYITQTTVGYGDFTAATNLGRTLAVIQALFGQIYLVAVVGLIVGNLGRSRRKDSPMRLEPPTES